MNMTNMSFKVLISSSLASSIQEFEATHGLRMDPDTLSRATSKAKGRRLDNVKAYDNLVVTLTSLVQNDALHWRYQTMAMSFLELYMRPEIPASLELAQFETKSLLSEMPMVRKIALSSLSIMMVNMKIRTFGQGDAYSLIIRKATNPLKRVVTLPEKVPEDFTWEYLKASVAEINYDHPEKGYSICYSGYRPFMKLYRLLFESSYFIDYLTTLYRPAGWCGQSHSKHTYHERTPL